MKIYKNKLSFMEFYLFFSLLVVGFIFTCTDAEYDYNQQIARGYISREAVFFVIDNLSYKEAFSGAFHIEPDESDAPFVIDTTPKAAVNESFVLQNKILDNNQTAVEVLLMSGNGDYLASLHSGLIRGVVVKGNIVSPPLLSGRFFTEEESLSDCPLAVIGRNYKDSTYVRDNKKYFEYKNREYEVIGEVGFTGKSPIDDILFINLGSLTPEEQLNGMYYIDCSSDNEAIYNRLLEQSESLFGCGLKRREIPKAFVDVVAGGMYMKDYMKIIMILLGLITYINVLIQSTREKKVEISVMKIQGIHIKRMIFKTTKAKLISSFLGVLTGLFFDMIFLFFDVFSLPIMWVVNYLLNILIIAFIMLLGWVFIISFFEWKLNPKEVIHKV